MSIPKSNVDLTQAKQQNLRITRTNEGTITVDDLKIAQFIHTILNNENVRNVIDTLTTKLVLTLGRFTPERKVVLEEAKRWLHAHDHVPVIFDFDRPASRDFTVQVDIEPSHRIRSAPKTGVRGY